MLNLIHQLNSQAFSLRSTIIIGWQGPWPYSPITLVACYSPIALCNTTEKSLQLPCQWTAKLYLASHIALVFADISAIRTSHPTPSSKQDLVFFSSFVFLRHDYWHTSTSVWIWQSWARTTPGKDGSNSWHITLLTTTTHALNRPIQPNVKIWILIARIRTVAIHVSFVSARLNLVLLGLMRVPHHMPKVLERLGSNARVDF